MQDALDDFNVDSTPTFLREWLETCADSSLVANADPYFVSFCQKSDLLSQWRGYGGTDSRYCISFKTTGFVRKSDEFAGRPRPVIYSERKQRPMLRELVTRYIAGFRNAEDLWNAGLEKTVRTEFISNVMLMLVFFKHPSFAEEHEWRSVMYILRGTVANTVFINSGGVMKPFRLLVAGSTSGDKLPITEVIAGVRGREDRSVKSAELLLAQFGYSGVTVRASGVPLAS